MATRVVSHIQKAIHDNFSVTVSQTRTPSSPFNSLILENMDSSIDIAISFDGGTKWKTIKAGRIFSIDVDTFTKYDIKSLGGAVAVEAIYGVEA
jgi:hypothetical protein